MVRVRGHLAWPVGQDGGPILRTRTPHRHAEGYRCGVAVVVVPLSLLLPFVSVLRFRRWMVWWIVVLLPGL